ncbi:DnaJ-domain-containing protein [Wallemia mellicola]|uniref:DnaJ-domain-containing protein n=1 Tax=Wallemia mellicola TaxID=1708541 RepID=A0A4T0N9Z0_9BASI|nr:hypothetical protein E3Q23_02002 [Wallemia mellicola]TIB79669.1 DnaJ-domain-containing protein [Wallemia mellicola]TIB93569.1 DnaJ-domain-containing protein [Wallemia mellicola]TIC12847.1 DnaJ-domain-containing protein [Wallemia mellicola]TIC17291.1 DnaJ-domain-containing protein [Wallemia mellicola]
MDDGTLPTEKKFITIQISVREAKAILGVEGTPTVAGITSQYKKLALRCPDSLRYHPDKNPAEKQQEAAERFKQLVQAVQVLSDSLSSSSDTVDSPSFDFTTVFKDTPFFNAYMQDFTYTPPLQPSCPGPSQKAFRWYDPPKPQGHRNRHG